MSNLNDILFPFSSTRLYVYVSFKSIGVELSTTFLLVTNILSDAFESIVTESSIFFSKHFSVYSLSKFLNFDEIIFGLVVSINPPVVEVEIVFLHGLFTHPWKCCAHI